MTVGQLIKAALTYHPSSAQVALTYACNVNRPLKDKLTSLRLAYYAYLLLLAARLCLNSFLQQAYNRYDLTMRLLSSTVTHHMLGLSVAPFPLLAIAFDYVYCVRASRKVALMLTDILVINRITLKELYSRASSTPTDFSLADLPQLTFQLASLFLGRQSNTLFDLLLHGYHWSRPPLAHYLSYSGRTRGRLAILHLLTELLIQVLLPIRAVWFLFLAGQVFFLTRRHFFLAVSLDSWALLHLLHEWPLFLVDILVGLLTAVHLGMNKISLTFKTLYLVLLSWYMHAGEVTRAAIRQMAIAVQTFQRGGRKASTVSSVYGGAAHLCARIDTIWASVFMREHSRLLVDLVHLNSSLASPLLFWLYAPILTSSVYILCLLYFFQLHWFLWVLLFGQLLGLVNTFALLAPLPVVVRALYDRRVEGQLYWAQMLCQGGSAENAGNFFLRIKLKLLLYYEVLRTENRSTFTFGSHSKIENTWLWELAIMYSSFILYAFKMFIKQSLALKGIKT